MPALADPVADVGPRLPARLLSNADFANTAPLKPPAWLARPAKPALVLTLEGIYQATSAADIATTCVSGRLPGVVEEGAGGILGKHPSCGADIAFGLARGALHALVTHWLVKHAPARFYVLGWEGGTIAPEAIATAGNAAIIQRGH